MKFRTFQLIINSQSPTEEDIKKVPKIGIKIFSHASNLYEIDSAIYENRFLGMSCSYDNKDLYKDKVINENTKKEEDNPRNPTQIECRNQLFVYYDMDKELLYISDITQRAFLKQYLSETLGKEVLIKSIISSLEDFQAAVTGIKRATFIQERNVIKPDLSTIFQGTTNACGLDAPDKLIIKADYGYTPVGIAKNVLQDLQKKIRNDEFKSIILIGEDDRGVERFFDFSSLIEAIDIAISKDKNGQYDSNEVRILVLNKIR